MISFCTADKIEAASFSGSAERQTVKRRHAAIASRLQAVIRSVELIVQPDAHDVAVEACRGLHVVDEKGTGPPLSITSWPLKVTRPRS